MEDENRIDLERGMQNVDRILHDVEYDGVEELKELKEKHDPIVLNNPSLTAAPEPKHRRPRSDKGVRKGPKKPIAAKKPLDLASDIVVRLEIGSEIYRKTIDLWQSLGTPEAKSLLEEVQTAVFLTTLEAK